MSARGQLLFRGTLLLLAFDVWLLHVPRGGRYGAGGFNVAHFAWLDALQPLPSPVLYVGLMLGTGLVAFVLALSGPVRALTAAVFTAYTYGWAMSLQDSYQHHYLLSLGLLCLCFLPEEARARAEGSEPPEPWALQLFAFTLGVVYLFAAVSKLDPVWRQGVPLASLLGRSAWMGAPTSTVATLAAAGVVVLEFVTAGAYVVTALPGSSVGSAARRRLRRAGLAAAVLLHVGVELSGVFAIGAFSAYALLFAVGLFAPRAWLEAAMRAAARLRPSHPSRAEAPGPAPMPGLRAAGSVAVLLGAVALGMLEGLPGARVALPVAAVGVLVFAWLQDRRGSPARLLGLQLSLAVGLGVLALVMIASSVRFDLHRFIAGDLRRRGQAEAAGQAYDAAARFAPVGWVRPEPRASGASVPEEAGVEGR